MTTYITKADEITPEWLTETLNAGGILKDAVRVKHAESRKIGTGQMAACYAVDLRYTGSTDAPQRLLAKIPSQDAAARQIARFTQCYSREVNFYREIAAHVETRTPECYFADASDDHERFVVLMEDMSPALECGQIEGCTPAQAKLALEHAAALHGASWHSPALLGIDWLKSGLAIWQSFGEHAAPIQQALRQAYGESLDEEILALGDRLADGGLVQWMDSVSRPRCLWHGDFRLDNLLFDASDGTVPLAVLDWQSISMADGTIDASYFVGGNLEVEDRREHEEALMRHYHAVLLESGASDYDWDTCWREYRINAIAGYFAGALSLSSVEHTERGDKMLTAMVRRSGQQMLDHDSLSLLNG